MGQYLQFRSWMRSSSGAEKGLATTAVVVVVGLTGWSLVPAGGPGGASSLEAQGVANSNGQGGAVGGGTAGSAVGPTSTVPGGGQVGPAAGSGTTGGISGTGGGGGGTSGSGAAPGPAGGGGGTTTVGGAKTSSTCGTLSATAPGVTPSTISIAVTLLNLGGAIGNSAVGVAPPADAQKMVEAVVADINGHGGVACRKLKATYYSVNPIDTSSAPSACLQIAQAAPYAVIDLGGFSYPPGAADCVAQKKIPIFTSAGPVTSELKQYAPYLMSLSADITVATRTSILGLNKLGWFSASHGFKKLGLYMDECSSEINNSLLKDLASIGIAEKDISIYKFSCPGGGFGSASDASAAVVQHRQDGVTNVIPVTGGGSFKSYSQVAQRQGYKPHFTAIDYNGQFITTTGATGPDQDGFDGSIGVTTMKMGMPSSGFSDAPTKACEALFKRHGLDPAWVTSGYNGGSTCSNMQVFDEAASKAPGLTRAALAQGLGSLGRVPMAYMYQDAVFKPGKVTGGDFWWPVQYHKSCNCWKVLNRTPQPSFQ